MNVIIMGVAGSGKSTVGAALAGALGWTFVDGDDLHPTANVEKMARGEPLDDRDRRPWLDAVAERLATWRGEGRDGVIACSALKRAYRDRIRRGDTEVAFVHLDMPRDPLARRLALRTGHFMPAELLDSQLATLEPPLGEEGAVILPPRASPADAVAEIIALLALTPA